MADTYESDDAALIDLGNRRSQSNSINRLTTLPRKVSAESSVVQKLQLGVSFGILVCLMIIAHEMLHVSSVIKDENYKDIIQNSLSQSISGAVKNIPSILIEDVVDGSVPSAVDAIFSANYSAGANLLFSIISAAKTILANTSPVNDQQEANITMLQIAVVANVLQKWEKLPSVNKPFQCTKEDGSECDTLEMLQHDFSPQAWGQLHSTCLTFAAQISNLPWQETTYAPVICNDYAVYLGAGDGSDRVKVRIGCMDAPEPYPESFFSVCDFGCNRTDYPAPITCCFQPPDTSARFCDESLPWCPLFNSISYDLSGLHPGGTYHFSYADIHRWDGQQCDLDRLYRRDSMCNASASLEEVVSSGAISDISTSITEMCNSLAGV